MKNKRISYYLVMQIIGSDEWWVTPFLSHHIAWIFFGDLDIPTQIHLLTNLTFFFLRKSWSPTFTGFHRHRYLLPCRSNINTKMLFSLFLDNPYWKWKEKDLGVYTTTQSSNLCSTLWCMAIELSLYEGKPHQHVD